MFDKRQRQALQDKFENSKNPVQVTMIAEALLLLLAAFTLKDGDLSKPEEEDDDEQPTEPSPPAEPPAPPPADPVPQPDPDLTLDVDGATDLEEVPGIGPEEARLLKNLGIGSMKMLAHWASPAHTAWTETITPENVARWRAEAQRILAKRENP